MADDPNSNDANNPKKNGGADYGKAWQILTNGDENKKSREDQEKDASTIFVTAAVACAAFAGASGPETAGVGAAAAALFAADLAVGYAMYKVLDWLGATAGEGVGFAGKHPEIAADIQANGRNSKWWLHYPGLDGWNAVGRPQHNWPDLNQYPAYKALPHGEGLDFPAIDPPPIPDAAPGSWESIWYPIFVRLTEINLNSAFSPSGTGVDVEQALNAVLALWNATHDGPGELVDVQKGWGPEDPRVLVPISKPVTINRGPAKPMPLVSEGVRASLSHAFQHVGIAGGVKHALNPKPIDLSNAGVRAGLRGALGGGAAHGAGSSTSAASSPGGASSSPGGASSPGSSTLRGSSSGGGGGAALAAAALALVAVIVFARR